MAHSKGRKKSYTECLHASEFLLHGKSDVLSGLHFGQNNVKLLNWMTSAYYRTTCARRRTIITLHLVYYEHTNLNGLR